MLSERSRHRAQIGFQQSIGSMWCYPRPERHVSRSFGWHWRVTEEIDFLTTELARRGRIIDVWETPQWEAVEWLARRGILPFPVDFDGGLHGAFCRILSMEAICREPALRSDIDDAIQIFEEAAAKVNEASDMLYSIRSDITHHLKSIGIAIGNLETVARHNDGEEVLAVNTDGNPIRQIAIGQDNLAIGIGSCLGFLKSDIKFRERVYSEFMGPDHIQAETGRPANWAARFVAMSAADIYRTTWVGPIRASKKGGKPSFIVFLKMFAKGYPEAMYTDHRDLAREIFKGSAYGGNQFAPLPYEPFGG